VIVCRGLGEASELDDEEGLIVGGGLADEFRSISSVSMTDS
jgi:hypothetical protein